MKKRSGVLAAAVAAALVTAGTAQADWLIKGIAGTPGTTITNYASADNLINGTNGFTNAPGFPVVASLDYWNTADGQPGGSPGGRGKFKAGAGGAGSATDVVDLIPPGLPSGVDNNDFVVVGSGNIIANAGGPTKYTFYNNTDDGSRLKIDGVQVITDNVLSGDHDATGDIVLTDGVHSIEWMWFERGGGAQGEISYSSPDLGTPRTILTKAGKLTGDADGSVNGITLDDAATVTTYKSVVVNGRYTGSGTDNLNHAIADKGLPGSGNALMKTFNLSNDGGNPAPNQSGHFGGDVDVPGIARGSDNYIAVGTGKLIIKTEGDYYFAILSDDGGEMTIDGVAVVHDETQHGAGFPNDLRFSAAIHLTAGAHDIDALYFENGGGSGGEMMQTDAAHATFCLLGDVAGGCLEVTQDVPEPASLTVLALGAIGLMARRRRA